MNGSHTCHLLCTKVEQFKALPATRRSTLTPEIHEEILTLRRCRATPRIIANKLSDDGVWIGVQDVKNIIRKCKQELQNGVTPIEALCAHLWDKDIISEAKVDDKTNRLTHLFIQPTACAALTQMYGTLMFMDCTYKTNRYNMPLLHVASVTGNDETFS